MEFMTSFDTSKLFQFCFVASNLEQTGRVQNNCVYQSKFDWDISDVGSLKKKQLKKIKQTNKKCKETKTKSKIKKQKIKQQSKMTRKKKINLKTKKNKNKENEK